MNESVDVLVRLGDGTLRGRAREGIARYLGIAYAAPPVGGLRFMPPRAPAGWEGVREADRFGPAAMQDLVDPSGSVPISEDCLTLNVWSPVDTEKAPVLVWLHGGANVSGRASDPSCDGSAFARDGIVCVTVNYRLGALGFLDLSSMLGEAYATSGNIGLQDQLAALQWVRRNIASFGGDPHRVTLGGQSAGAKDAWALAGSPQAKGLCQGLISHSGSGHTAYSREQAADVTRRFLELAGLTCEQAGRLRTLSTASILDAQRRLLSSHPTAFPFRGVVDGVFLRRTPIQAVAEGAVRGIPILLGTTADESRAFFSPEDVPRQLGKGVAHLDGAGVELMRRAYADGLADLPEADRLFRLLTAELYWIPSVRLAEAQTRDGGDAWMYRFDRPDTAGPLKGFAAHACDLPYAWNHHSHDVAQDPASLRHRMHEVWVQFIKRGRPGDELGAWPTYGERQTTLIIGESTSLADDPRRTERLLWEGRL